MGHPFNATACTVVMVCNKEVKMTLEELKLVAKQYSVGSLSEREFRFAIVDYLRGATPDDFMAIALWLNEAKTEH